MVFTLKFSALFGKKDDIALELIDILSGPDPFGATSIETHRFTLHNVDQCRLAGGELAIDFI
jgi:hypothetical protein